MSCKIRSEEQTDRLLAYSAGKLRGDAAADLQRHIDGCSECASVMRAQMRVWDLLDTWEARPVSADFNRRLYARIEAIEKQSWAQRFGSAVREFFRPLVSQPAFPLAGATLVLVAGFMLDHPSRPVHPHSPAAQLNKVDVDQVEATLDDLDMLRQFDASSQSM